MHPVITRTVLSLLIPALCPLVMRAQTINIWDGVKGKPRVEMTVYRAAGSGRKAVVVCPGGSYFWHDMRHEGREVGEWLSSRGITAFVLKYRTARWPAFFTHYRLVLRGVRYPDAQDDLRQALRLVRRRASDYGIRPDSVGAVGFSAGGHLAMSAAQLFAPADRPAFVGAVYPVVTLRPPYAHKRSRRALLGDDRQRNRRLRDSLSLELHASADCPPVFLVGCKDDPVVDPHNASLLDSALTRAHVPHLYIQYATGGHGFGASEEKGTAESRQWKARFIEWLGSLDGRSADPATQN